MSCARAIEKHLIDWLRLPSYNPLDSELFSMGVLSNGNPYGVPDNLVFSFPCRHRPINPPEGLGLGLQGAIEVVPDLNIDLYTQSLLDITVKELLEEREAAKEYLTAI